jgi:hypothetical protein
MSPGLPLPQSSMLRGIAPPASLLRASRYYCDGCATNKQQHGDHARDPEALEAVMTDVGRLYSRSIKLLQLGSAAKCRPVGDGVLGHALVSIGVLQGDSAAVCSGIADLVNVYGEFSHPAIGAELQLAEVLLARADVLSQYSGQTKDLAKLHNAEEVLRATAAKLLKRGPTVADTYGNELNTVVALLQRVTAAYSELPTAKREHQGMHYLVDVLTPVLGRAHPLVGSALGQITRYYLKLSHLSREGSVAGSTALQTAGKYGCQWLECLASGDDATVVESLLTLLREEVVRVLRAGGAPDRAAALQIADDCREVVLAKLTLRKQPPIVTSLSLLDDVFKAQLKVVEETQQSAAFAAEIKQLRAAMVEASVNVSRHTDRANIYCRKQIQKIGDMRKRVTFILSKVRDTDVIAKAHEFIAKHDELLRVAPPPGTGAAEETEDAGLSNKAAAAMAAYASPYAMLPCGFGNDEEDERDERGVHSSPSTMRLVRGASAVSPQRRQTGAMPRLSSSEALKRDRQTAASMRKVFPKVALGSSQKNFARPN